MRMTQPASFVFVAQAGRLEGMALLLAASLRHHAGFDHELIAAVPGPAAEWGSLARETLDAFDELRVRSEPIQNPFGQAYPIGNKFACLALPARSERLVFLDSDMVMLDALPDSRPFRAPIEAVPTSRSHCPEALWEKLYRAQGLEPPSSRLRTTGSRESTPPYFNSGVVSISRDTGFAETWLQCAQRIDCDPGVPHRVKRPWLDQVALPIAAALLGHPVTPLPIEYNFPSWEDHLEPGTGTLFYHYQKPEVLLRRPDLLLAARQALSNFPLARRAVSLHGDMKIFAGEHS
jgi:hypothetical protein